MSNREKEVPCVGHQRTGTSKVGGMDKGYIHTRCLRHLFHRLVPLDSLHSLTMNEEIVSVDKVM